MTSNEMALMTNIAVNMQKSEVNDVLDKIREEIKDNTYFINETTEKEGIDYETVEKIIDKYKAETEYVDIEDVKALPPVTPDPKMGHWEKTTDKYCYWYKCSCCGTKAPKTEWGNDYFSPYCPECGAKMSEVPTDSEKE